MTNHLPTLARRALGAAAVALTLGAVACGGSPTAPDATPRAAAASGTAKRLPAKAGTARRGGYNVVAD